MASWITPITAGDASGKAKEYIEKYQLDLNIARKAAVELNDPVVFECVERNAWDMDDEVKKKVGGRYADILEAAVSVANRSVVCSTFYTGLLKERYGIDVLNDPQFRSKFDEKDAVVWDYGTQIAQDMHGMTQELKDRLLSAFTQEQILVLTGMAAVVQADNTFESILEID